MDHDLENDPPAPAASTEPRRFAKLSEASRATCPQLAPVAAAMIGQEEAFDEELLAGLVDM